MSDKKVESVKVELAPQKPLVKEETEGGFAKYWKSALKFAIGVVVLFVSLRTMGYTVKDAATEGKAEVITYWTTLWLLVKSGFKNALKQVIMNIHQTFILIIAAWLFSFIKNIWKSSQGRVFTLVDYALGNYSTKKRTLIKEDIEKIVDANITLIENAFKHNVLDNEEAEEAMVKSQHKLSSVLTLTIHDIMKKKIDRDLEEDYDREEIIDMLVLEVEQGLLRKKADKKDVVFGTSFSGDATAIATKTSPSVLAVMKGIEKKLPRAYQDKIKAVVAKE